MMVTDDIDNYFNFIHEKRPTQSSVSFLSACMDCGQMILP